MLQTREEVIHVEYKNTLICSSNMVLTPLNDKNQQIDVKSQIPNEGLPAIAMGPESLDKEAMPK